MIELRNICKQISQHWILQNFSYTFDDYGLYFLKGDNGCGKTTLLYLLALLDSEYEGSYRIDGREMNGMKKKEREQFQKENISLLLPKGNLIDFLNVDENMHLYCENPIYFLDSNHRSTLGLSGGEELLYALGNEMGKNKKILLLDEVTSCLCDENEKKVMRLLLDYSKTHFVIMASHDTRVLEMGIQIHLPSREENPYSLIEDVTA